MDKSVVKKHGKNCYLIGKGTDGLKYYLEEGSWDCEWYWGFGYVESYIPRGGHFRSHSHFDIMFLNNHNKNGYDVFKEFFAETTLDDSETWKLLELMRSFYTARAYSDMLHIGGAHYTSNPARTIIQNDTEYERINKQVIPAIMTEVYKILGREN